MTIFADKLATLGETIATIPRGPLAGIAGALAEGRGRLVAAVGSGGSAVAAEFLARCRSTLCLGPTRVMTPMEFVLDDHGLEEAWLFSAGAANPDIAAAFHAARRSPTRPARLLTTSPDGATALAAAADPFSSSFTLPVAEPKDGFLATHSLGATVGALLAASDIVAGEGDADALSRVLANAVAEPGPFGSAADQFRPGDTIILIHDPQVAAVAVLVETCLWETGICPVQRVDMRNFAHGRHVWAARHTSTTFVLSLTSAETRAVWRPIDHALPAAVRRGEIDLGNAGRLRTATGILSGLRLVEALGAATGVDPGKPGRGDFAPAIYDDDALHRLARSLTPAVVHKRDAKLARDPVGCGEGSLCVEGGERVRRLATATFGAVVMDYDGTLVATEERFSPPRTAIAAELVRLVDEGLSVGVATGRGGSAASDLRQALPERVHSLVTIGYYNGGHVRTLDVNIEASPPPQDPDVLAAAVWLEGSDLLKEGSRAKSGRMQITIDRDALRDPGTILSALRGCPAVADGRLRVTASQHSIDVLPATSTKENVVKALHGRGGAVLGLGDSGAEGGNDHELLLCCHGISVDRVCTSASGSWSLFGDEATGPDATLRILRALKTADGIATVDIVALGLDVGDENEYGTRTE